jgi:FkbM family methyltransferase
MRYSLNDLMISMESPVSAMARLLSNEKEMYSKIMQVFRNRFKNCVLLGILPDRQLIFFREGTDDHGVVYEIYKQQVYERLFKLCKNDVVADVGAHLGVFSLKAAKRVGRKGLVLAFEPERTNFRLLCLNVKVNNLTNAKVFMVGLGEQEKLAKLFLNSQTSGHSFYLRNKSKYCLVEVTTLDKIVGRHASGVCDFLKIDVEGYELDVLRGAKEILTKNSVRVVTAAYHYPDEIQEIAQYLRKLGYQNRVWFNVSSKQSYIYSIKKQK